MNAPKPALCVPVGCRARNPNMMKLKPIWEWDKWGIKTASSLPRPCGPRQQGTSGSHSNEQGHRVRGTSGEGRASEGERAPQIRRAGERGRRPGARLPTRMNGNRANQAPGPARPVTRSLLALRLRSLSSCLPSRL